MATKKQLLDSTLDDTAEFLHQLDRFRMIMKKKISSKYQGVRQTSHAGSGLTFKDYKAYVPGDDFRGIDWRVYARTGKFFVRRFEEERNVTVHIIIDASASMDFGKPRKFDYASLIGIGFAYLSTKSNEKFNVSTFAEELKPIRARKGMKQLVRLLDILKEEEIGGRSEFSSSLESAKGLIKSKSVIILLSDFLYPLEEIRNTLMRFKGSEVLCVQVLDKLERSFALEGDFILKDSELGTELRTFISRRVKHMYRGELEHHVAAIKNVCEQLKHHFASVTTDMQVFDAFYEAYVAMER